MINNAHASIDKCLNDLHKQAVHNTIIDLIKEIEVTKSNRININIFSVIARKYIIFEYHNFGLLVKDFLKCGIIEKEDFLYFYLNKKQLKFYSMLLK